MTSKSFIGYSLLAVFCCFSIFFLWNFDLKYYVSEHQTTIIAKPISEPILTRFTSKNNLSYLHFYDHNCPVSRQNLEHLHAFAKRNPNQAKYYVISKNGLPNKQINNIIYLSNEQIQLFESFNITSTPTAVIISNNTISYEGNYHTISGICSATNIQSTAPIIALEATSKNAPLPLDLSHLKSAISCSL